MPQTKHLHTIFSAIDEGYCLARMIRDDSGRPLDYRFLETNPLFDELTGLDDAAGRTALEVIPTLDRHWIETYDRVARGERMRFQSSVGAQGRWLDVFATPVPPEGDFVLVVRDVTEARRSEAECEAARARAERLLLELNHRVMNTLSMVTSIVRMEAREIEPGTPGGAAIERLQTRLAAVAELYRALNNAASECDVQTQSYLDTIAHSVAISVADRSRIEIVTEIEDMRMSTAKAAPLGLLVNELMTNAIKYAFPSDRRGRIAVTLATRPDGQVTLSVRDDGVGSSEDGPGATGGEDHIPGSGVGGNLIAAFADQIQGQVRRETGVNGTSVTITFSPTDPDTAESDGEGGAPQVPVTGGAGIVA